MDVDGFEAWAVRATPQLFRYARHLMTDWQGAEDLVQDTLAKLYVHRSRMDEAGNLTSYALQTMFHLFVSRRRRRSSTEIVSDCLPEALDAQATPETRLVLSEALASLKPAERAVIVARYAHDLSVADVAVLMDRSEGWVRTTSHRALARLRDLPHLATLTP